MENPGKILMKHVWRFQQVGGLIAVTLMCLNLAIPIYVYMGWRFVELGIPAELDWLIIIIIFLIIFSFTLLFGYAYDRILKLWRYHQIVAMERNPFQKGRITPNELIQWQYIIIPYLYKTGFAAEAEFNLKWNEANMEHDPELRKEVYRIIDWIEDYKLKDVDERWLKDISEITKKKYMAKFGKIKPDW